VSEQSNKDMRIKSPNTSNWPDGWFVFQDGRVDGPLSASEAFSLKFESADGKSKLVSRKGFSQWYPIKDLAEIYRITDAVSENFSTEQSRMEKTVEEASKTIVAFSNVGTKVQAGNISAKMQGKSEISSPVPSFVEANAVSPSTKESIFTAKRDEKAIETSDKKTPKNSAHATILQEFALVKEPLRLGKIRNPWLISFLAIPCTFGLSWGAWISSSFREVEFHRLETNKSKFIFGVLALIPIVHIFVAYALAKKVKMMEQENKYSNTSPILAAVFAIVPPFSVAYLQDAINQHWITHVKYSLLQKQKKS